MSELFEIMLAPCVVSLILTAVHTYLGLHVVERGVLFVDLALAQMAALGSTIGFLCGFELHSTSSYLYSLGFAWLGAGLFALSRDRLRQVPQEAVVGVVYAVSAALAILVLSRAPEGSEELRSLLVGHLLFIGWPEVVKVSFIYAIIGVALWNFHSKFALISFSPKLAVEQGMSLRLWDFVFYGMFAVVITSSVELAGVLLVFTFLIVPSICGMLLANSLSSRLTIGWICGFITTVVGNLLSYVLDFPTGATIVATFGCSLLLCIIIHAILGKQIVDVLVLIE